MTRPDADVASVKAGRKPRTPEQVRRDEIPELIGKKTLIKEEPVKKKVDKIEEEVASKSTIFVQPKLYIVGKNEEKTSTTQVQKFKGEELIPLDDEKE